MATKENLKEAFAGESQANRKYLAFAKRAEDEGHPNIAKLFRAAAAAETVHAFSHLAVLGGIQGTLENFQTAMEGEDFEYKDMYPKFVEEAKNEDESRALLSFKRAMAVEQVHASMYLNAINKLKEGQDLQDCKIYVCSVCGNTVIDDVPDKCPVCSTGKEKFTEVQ